MKTVKLLIKPLDVLFFRDGRPFTTRGESGLPNPQNLTGMIRTYLMSKTGVNYEKYRNQLSNSTSIIDAMAKLEDHQKWLSQVTVRGPWLYKDTPLVPIPANFLKNKDNNEYDLIAPKNNLPGWEYKDGMLPLLGKDGRWETVPGFLNFEGLKTYLEGKTPTEANIIKSEELFVEEERTGLAINPDSNTNQESMLYAVKFLRLKSDVCFCAEIDLPQEQKIEDIFPEELCLPWGGENRRVQIDTIGSWHWPSHKSTNDQYLTLLISPAIFMERNGFCWRPNDLSASQLKSAAVSEPLAVSGWDLARKCPKPTRYAVTAGSVYFWEGKSPSTALNLSDFQDDQVAGWGVSLVGNWPK